MTFILLILILLYIFFVIYIPIQTRRRTGSFVLSLLVFIFCVGLTPIVGYFVYRELV